MLSGSPILFQYPDLKYKYQIIRTLIDFLASPKLRGCFYVSFRKFKDYKTGYQVQVRFVIAQHSRDYQLINSFIKYFNSGNISENLKAVYFTVSKFSDIEEKIIPFFQKFQLQGSKRLDFEDLCKIVKLMNQKSHLTLEGLEQIKKIKTGMNTGIN